MRCTFLWIALALAPAAACQSVDSEDIGTGAIFANLGAVADGDNTVTTARLKVGGASSNAYLALSESDTLTASFGDESRGMSEHSDPFGGTWYSAEFSGSGGGTEVGISFVRDGDPTSDESATDSRITLPEPLTLTAPTQGETYSRAESSFVVVWEGEGQPDDLYLTIDGDCVAWTISEEDIEDSGVFTVSPGILAPDDDDGSTCIATITLERSRSASVDRRFGEGGVFLASQKRTVDFTSTP